MGDIFQIDWVKSLLPLMKSPILEIGSKRYGSPPKYFDYKTLFKNNDKDTYVGIDLSVGEGVDVVVDMTEDVSNIKRKLNHEKFNTIICLSVMEHVENIFAFSQNVDQLTNLGGMILISVPFVWGIHAYPEDYWRFTPKAIAYLFKGYEFDQSLSQLHTANGNIIKLKDMQNDYNYLNDYMKVWKSNSISSKVFRLLRRSLNNTEKKYLPPFTNNDSYFMTAFDLVGFKKEKIFEIQTNL